MRTILIWVTLVTIEVCGAAALWLSKTESHPHGVYGAFLFFAPMVALITIFIIPAWIAASCSIVKMIIESAYNKNYERVRTSFQNAGWIIFPLPKYAEIIRVLRYLSKDRKTKPENISPNFSECLVLDNSGRYVLTIEGKLKMLNIVNKGWFSAKKADDLRAPKTLKYLMWLIVVVALIRGIILILQMLTRH